MRADPRDLVRAKVWRRVSQVIILRMKVRRKIKEFHWYFVPAAFYFYGSTLSRLGDGSTSRAKNLNFGRLVPAKSPRHASVLLLM